MEQLGFDLIVLHSKHYLKFASVSLPGISLSTLHSRSPISLYTQKCINSVSILYKARENCIYTCKNVYLCVIHLIIQFTNILLQILQRKRPTNYTIVNYTIAVKYNFLQLYTTEVYILCFCFCIKREKHISSCYTLIIMQYTYILIRFNCMQNKLYNCSEIGQRIIQFRPANYTLVYVQRIIQFLYLLWSAIMQTLLQHTNMNFLFAIFESCPFINPPSK